MNTLPSDILLEILKYILPYDVITALTCKRFNNAVKILRSRKDYVLQLLQCDIIHQGCTCKFDYDSAVHLYGIFIKEGEKLNLEERIHGHYFYTEDIKSTLSSDVDIHDQCEYDLYRNIAIHQRNFPPETKEHKHLDVISNMITEEIVKYEIAGACYHYRNNLEALKSIAYYALTYDKPSILMEAYVLINEHDDFKEQKYLTQKREFFFNLKKAFCYRHLECVEGKFEYDMSELYKKNYVYRTLYDLALIEDNENFTSIFL